MHPTIVVVGSLNMDFIVSVDRLPAAGETVLGRDFQMIPGGKGANQACAAGKLGGAGVRTRMVGRVGYDAHADHLKASLSAAGVDVKYVHATRSQPTGIALIAVERSGQNSIIVASGANHALRPQDMTALSPVFSEACWVLFQLETPLETVAAGLRLARECGAKTILDPAPVQHLPRDLLAHIDVLTPNETEACALLGNQPHAIHSREAPAIARSLRQAGASSVLLKLGAQGSYYESESEQVHSAAFPMDAVDTTAAGDVFNAALAVALTESRSTVEALRFANASAALSVTRAGAQSSIPTRAEVENFLAARS